MSVQYIELTDRRPPLPAAGRLAYELAGTMFWFTWKVLSGS